MNENTETLKVSKKGEGYEITVQHDQSGSAYGIDLSKIAYEQLRLHFVSNNEVAVCPDCGSKDMRPYKNYLCCYNCGYMRQTD